MGRQRNQNIFMQIAVFASLPRTEFDLGKQGVCIHEDVRLQEVAQRQVLVGGHAEPGPVRRGQLPAGVTSAGRGHCYPFT